MDAPGYLDHFRLHSAPFAAAPDASLFYAEGARGEVLGALAYAVTHGDGIVKITGDAGSGMTMMCHALARQLAGQAIIIHMEPASLGPLGVIHATSIALGLDPDGKRSDEVLRLMQSQLSAMRAGGRHAVLMADHADLLPPEALEEIRLLTNLAGEQGALMQIVLLGQPASSASLRQPAMRQIRERITLSFVMPALTADELPALLAHRLRAAGYEGLDMFAADAARLLASHAKGDLRKLIGLAHQSLEAAASEGAVHITARHVQAAVRGRLPALRPRGERPVIAGAVAAVAVIGIGAAAVLAARAPAPVTPKSTPITALAVPAAPQQNTAMAATAGSAPGATPHTTPDTISATAASGGAMNGRTPEATTSTAVALPTASTTEPLAVSAPASRAEAALNSARTASMPLAPQLAAATPTRAIQPAAALAPASTPASAPQANAALNGTKAASVPLAPQLTAAAPARAVQPAAASVPASTPTSASAPARAPASTSAPAKPAANAATMMAAGAAVGGDTAAPAAKPSSLLQQTLKATQTWLRDEPDSQVSIKIEDFPASEQARIEAFLVEVRGAIGLRDVHAYPTFNNGVHRIGIAYGSYSSEQQAAQALAALKEQLKGRRSYVPKTRTIGAIRIASARASRHIEK